VLVEGEAGTRLAESMLGRPASVEIVARAAARGNPLYLRDLFAQADRDPLDAPHGIAEE
jgi:hypothetical protein